MIVLCKYEADVSLFDVLYVRALFSDAVVKSHLKAFCAPNITRRVGGGAPIKTITVVPFDKALGSQLSEDVS